MNDARPPQSAPDEDPSSWPSWLGRLPRPLRVTYRAIDRMINHDGLEIAGYIAFTAFTALFPFSIFLAAIAGFLGSAEAAEKVIDLMFRFVPEDVAKTLAPAVTEVMTNRRGGLLTFGIVVTLWTASNGIESLRLALSRAYEIQTMRAIWIRRLQSILFVVVGAFVLFFMSLTILLGPIVWEIADQFLALGESERLVWLVARYAFTGLLLFGGLLALHYWLPRQESSFRFVLPGVLLTLALWLLGATAFSIYLGSIADYSVMYGSLGGVVITLFFFYITAILFILGAEFNAVLHNPAAKTPPRIDQEDA